MHKTARRHLVHPVPHEYFLNTPCVLWLCSELSTVDSIMLRTSKEGVVVLVLKSLRPVLFSVALLLLI